MSEKSSNFAPAFGKRVLTDTVLKQAKVMAARTAELETDRRYFGRLHRKTAGLTNYFT